NANAKPRSADQPAPLSDRRSRSIGGITPRIEACCLSRSCPIRGMTMANCLRTGTEKSLLRENPSPLTPGGVSSLVGDLPWHYATEYLTIAYRADPAAIAASLPEPLAPGPEPDLAYVAFSRWWSLWDNQPDM